MEASITARSAKKAPGKPLRGDAAFLARLHNLHRRLAEARLDFLLVGSLPNVHYLTGFSGSAGALVVSPSDSTLFTDSRYDLQAHQEVLGSRIKIVKGDALAAAAASLASQPSARVGFESESVTWQAHRRLKELLPRARLLPAAGWVETLRVQKDPQEIQLIRNAVNLGSRAYEETLPLLKPGITEAEVAAEIEYRMRRYGGERPSFETIVAFGERAALPHARAGARRLRPNEFILMDLGVILNGYASDMTRTVFLGRAPRRAAHIYRAVLEAQLEAEQVIRAGRPAGDVDAAARRVLRRHGYERFFTHSTGHGLGREVHEPPRVARRQKTPLLEGSVITVEPGVYIAGYGGVRIEDVVLVQSGGHEVLTPSPKQLTEL